MSVAEWIDTYDIRQWRIIWSSYRKLVRKGFEPTTTEFLSDTLTDWAIRSWNCFLSFKVFLISNCQFHLSFSFSHQSDVLFSSTNIQIIFPSICRWMLISFFPTHPEMTQADGICNGFHYGIFSQIGTVEQGKFLFKHLYCQNAGN